ncbi:MAG: hypothetical protein K9M49_08790 [Candidatus Marinimicrobia bacterium]|nr:hypothetical protein [Candidatus Neomarinimicrobiota bacterium]MCF7905232.1 hypothetical protein [Candidatus Neomarinimicrobiota bacterium]
MIISLMLVISGYWSILGFRSIGHSVSTLLGENYESIEAAEVMIEALERQDSGVLLLLLGEWEKGRLALKVADSTFRSRLSFTFGNITEPGEEAVLKEIRHRYNVYTALLERPIVGTSHERDLAWYKNEVHPAFLGVKEGIRNFRQVNSKVLYQTASALQAKAERAVLPGMLAIVSALILTALFNYLIHFALISPILRLIEGIHRYREGHEYHVEIYSRDEVRQLADEVKSLISQLKRHR